MAAASLLPKTRPLSTSGTSRTSLSILDFRIVLRTLLLLYSGEQINQEAVLAARRVRPNAEVSSDVLAVVARPAEAAATAQSAA